jgi:hypothetical protein
MTAGRAFGGELRPGEDDLRVVVQRRAIGIIKFAADDSLAGILLHALRRAAGVTVSIPSGLARGLPSDPARGLRAAAIRSRIVGNTPHQAEGQQGRVFSMHPLTLNLSPAGYNHFSRLIRAPYTVADPRHPIAAATTPTPGHRTTALPSGSVASTYGPGIPPTVARPASPLVKSSGLSERTPCKPRRQLASPSG